MEKYKMRTTSPYILLATLLPIGIVYYKSDMLLSFKSTEDMFLGGFLVIMLIVFYWFMLNWFLKGRKRKRIIDELILREDYRKVIIAGINERLTSGKHPTKYYVYICEDPETKNIYEADQLFDITDSDIELWDSVRLYESHSEKNIYWVDLNQREPGKWLKKLSQEAIEYGEESFLEVKKSAKKEVKFTPLSWIFIFWILFLYSIISFGNNLIVYQNSIETTWVVSEISTYNSSCGSKNNHDCTKYMIIIDLKDLPKNEFGLSRSTVLTINSVSWKNQPKSLSKYQVGESIHLLIRKKNIDDLLLLDGIKIQEDLEKKIKTWTTPLFIYGIITFLFLSMYIYQKFIKNPPKE